MSDEFKISAVVLSKNEEANIGPCLEGLKWCDEIVVIDDHSQDKTARLAEDFPKTKVFKRKLNDDFSSQRNYGLQKAKGEWVFFVDADERVTPALRKEIIDRLASGRGVNFRHDGFYLKRTDFFGGRQLCHGETSRVRLLRLARRNSGRWTRKVHETWQVRGKTGDLKNPLLHYPHPTIDELLKAVNDYSTVHAASLKEEGRQSSLFKIIAYPAGKFFVNYFFRLGLLDKTPGFVMAAMMSLHSFLSWSKLYLQQKQSQS